jgi:hypothetical protein
VTKRRKPTFAEIFTACYSSVFATAAVVDAIYKEDRRQNLDRELDEARHALMELRKERITFPADDEPDALGLTEFQRRVLTRHMKVIWRTKPYTGELGESYIDKDMYAPTQAQTARLFRLVNSHFDLPLKQRRATRYHDDYNRLEQLLLNEEVDPTIAQRQAGKPDHLFAEHRAIQKLVRTFMCRVEERDEWRRMKRTGSEPLPAPSFDNAGRLITQNLPEYTFRSLNQDEANEDMMILNERLRGIISNRNLSPLEMIGRVCYNLLVAPNAPDMFTYNTLMLAFDRLHNPGSDNNGSNSIWPSLSEAVIYSFFRNRLIQPTPATFELILNNCRNRDDHVLFYKMLGRVVGIGPTREGAKFRRRHITELLRGSWTFNWGIDVTRRTVTKNYIVEHAPLSKGLVETTMSGLIHFGAFEQAAALFRTCVLTGVRLSANLVRDLFETCVAKLDWKSALVLIRTFTDCNLRRIHLIMDGADDDLLYVLDKLRALLEICGLYEAEQRPSVRKVQNLNLSPERLYQLIDALRSIFPEPRLPAKRIAGGKHKEGSMAQEEYKPRDLLEAQKMNSLRNLKFLVASVRREVQLSARRLDILEDKLLDPRTFDGRITGPLCKVIAKRESLRHPSLRWRIEYWSWFNTPAPAGLVARLEAKRYPGKSRAFILSRRTFARRQDKSHRTKRLRVAKRRERTHWDEQGLEWPKRGKAPAPWWLRL